MILGTMAIFVRFFLNCGLSSLASKNSRCVKLCVNFSIQPLPGMDIEILTALFTDTFGVVLTWKYSGLIILTFVAMIHSSVLVLSYSCNNMYRI